MADDLARLGLEFEARGHQQANAALDQVASKSAKAEAATEGFAAAQKKATGATSQFLVQIERAIREQTALIDNQNRAASAARRQAAEAEKAAREAANLERRIAALKASYDPLGSAIDRVNRELNEADQLYKMGRISAQELAQANTVLVSRLNRLRDEQAKVATGARLTSNESLNLARQFSDVGVSIASGMPLWMIAIQQGSQIQDVFAQASARGVGFGAAVRGIMAVLAPFLPIIVAVGTALAAAFGGAALAARDLNKAHGDLTKTMGLTEAQMERLKDKSVKTSVTMRDVFVGTFDYIKTELGKLFSPVGHFLSDMLDKVSAFMVTAAKVLVGGFVGAFDAIKATWKSLPAAIGDLTISAANTALSAITNLINGAIGMIDRLIAKANGAAKAAGLNLQLGQIGNVSAPQFANPFAGSAAQTGSAAASAFSKGFADGGAMVDHVISDVAAAILKAAEDRIRKAAGKPGKSATDAGDRRSAQIDQMIEQAKANELQAQLALTKGVSARAQIEHQIVAAELKVQEAAIARQIVEIENDKTMGRAEKDALELKLGELKKIEEHIAVLKDAKIEEDKRIALIHEAASLEQARLASQEAGLQAQADLTKSSYARALIGQRLLAVEQQIELSKAQEAVDSTKIGTAEHERALLELDALKKRQAAETALQKEQTRLVDALSEAASAAGSLKDAISRHDWAGIFDSFQQTIQTIQAAFASKGMTGGLLTAGSAIGSLLGGRTGNAIAGGIGAFLGTSALGGALINAGSLGALGGLSGSAIGLGALLTGPGAIIAGLAMAIAPLLGNHQPSNFTASADFSGVNGPITFGGDKPNDNTKQLIQQLAQSVQAGEQQLQAMGITLGTTVTELAIGQRDSSKIHLSNGQTVEAAAGDPVAAAEAALKAVLSGATFVDSAEKKLVDSMIAAGKGFDDITNAIQGYAQAQQISAGLADQILQLSDPRAFDLQSVVRSIQAQRTAAQQMADQGFLTADQLATINGQLDTLAGLQIDQVMSRYAQSVTDATDTVQETLKRANEDLAGAQDNLSTANDNVSAARQALGAARDAVLAPYLTALTDFQGKTADAQKKLADANQAVTDAQQGVAAAYQRQAGVLQQSIDGFTQLAQSLGAFQGQLASMGLAQLSPQAQYAASRRAFLSTSALAARGDQGALGSLQSTTEAFLQASLASAPDRLTYLRDVAQARSAVAKAQGAATHQASVAQQQLTALTSLVSGVIDLGSDTRTVAQAMADLQTAQDKVVVETKAVSDALHDEALVKGVIDAIHNQYDPLVTINASVMTIPDALAQLQSALLAQAQAQAAVDKATATQAQAQAAANAAAILAADTAATTAANAAATAAAAAAAALAAANAPVSAPSVSTPTTPTVPDLTNVVIPDFGGGDLAGAVNGLRSEVSQLRTEQRAANLAIAKNTRTTADLLDRVTQGDTAIRTTAA